MDADRAYRGSSQVANAALGLTDPMNAYAAAARHIARDAHDDPGRAMAELPAFKAQFSILEVAMGKMSDLIAEHAAQVESDALAEKRLAAFLVDGSLAIMLMMTIGLILATGRHLVRPLLSLHHVMHCLSRGDLGAVVPLRSREDEIGMMAEAVAEFRENLIERRRLQDELETAERANNPDLSLVLKARLESLTAQSKSMRQMEENNAAVSLQWMIASLASVIAAYMSRS